MGNPVSTRLGVNQFWYKHWYTDKNLSLELKQDESLEKLIAFYLEYGLSFSSNPLLHEYWYRKNLKQLRVNAHQKNNHRFFRRFFYTNDALGIEHSYLIRNKTAEYFPMRLWVLKYSGWVIFSVQWFKPLKIKSKNKLSSGGSSYVGGIAKATPKAVQTKRIKLLLLLKLQYLPMYKF